jgi:TPP-dependent pyruvate/acetoin dehydrogenase alpha subunit
MEGFALDCTTDIPHVTRTLAAAIEKVRTMSRPMLIEAKVLRLRGHAAYDTCDYLKPGESDDFFARDPLPRFRAQVVSATGVAQVEAMAADERRRVRGGDPLDAAAEPLHDLTLAEELGQQRGHRHFVLEPGNLELE